MVKVDLKKAEGLILTANEESAIIAEAQERYSEFRNVEAEVSVDDNGNLLRVKYKAHGPKFERIRRITGYLVGTIDRWGDAKQAEERDRVKHESVSVSA